jgi:hypothetical protein
MSTLGRPNEDRPSVPDGELMKTDPDVSYKVEPVLGYEASRDALLKLKDIGAALDGMTMLVDELMKHLGAARDRPPHAISMPDYPQLVTDALRSFPLATETQIVGKIMQKRGGNADPTKIREEIKRQNARAR